MISCCTELNLTELSLALSCLKISLGRTAVFRTRVSDRNATLSMWLVYGVFKGGHSFMMPFVFRGLSEQGFF